MIEIAEIFNTYQSEGVQYGQPATFVRVSQCNKACNFCDTNFEKTKEYTPDELLYDIINHNNEVKAFKPLIIFTGGEPMLQYNKLFPVMDSLMKMNYDVSIETNGSILLPKDYVNQRCFFTCSPKDYEKYENFKHDVFEFNMNYQFCSFKFVVSSIKQIEIIADYLEDFNMEGTPIFIQPEFSVAKDIIPKIIECEDAKKLNYKFSLQTNKYLGLE